ncbi:uncharacterized protein LOC144861748 [Branchiostoma floridae x Branchiostoma japonicum]
MAFRVVVFGFVLTCVARFSAGVVDITLTNDVPFFGLSDDTWLYCYYTGTLNVNPQNSFDFGMEIDTGSGTTEFTAERNSGPTAGGRFVKILAAAGDFRVGAFSCEVTEGSQTEKAITFKIKTEADIWPEAFTVTANTGEEVTLQMVQKSSRTGTLEWKKDGTVVAGQTGLSYTIASVQSSDEGIYECYYQGTYSDRKQGIMRLIVRDCAADKWGPSCASDCPMCYNGGVCDDNSGECVCPPGFYGTNCETACTGDNIGTNCDKTCYRDGDCPGHLLCVMDPYGCSCASGLMGIECNTDCPDGMYGAGCTQFCNCANGPADCDKKTGACPGGCLDQWAGDSCQIAPDFLGYFTRTANKGLADNNDDRIDDISPGECARRCLQGTTTVPRGQCRSFDYFNDGSSVQCVLSRKNTNDVGTSLVNDGRFDYYHRNDFGPCTSFPCSNGKICTEESASSFSCACTIGWTGDNCEQDINECDPNPCINGGSCTQGVPGTYSCDCMDGWTGDNCGQDVNECDPNPCTNGGTCSQGAPGSGTYSCDCTVGWTGTNCGQDINECDPNPCNNGGSCTQGVPGTYSCDCTAGWTGDNCEQDIDECDPNPCINGGSCTQGVPGTYSCDCTDGWTGDNCEQDVNECDPNPCTNGGTCRQGAPGSGTYSCDCTVGWTGTNCEQDVNECSPNPCANGGSCTQGPAGSGTYSCTCTDEWTGDSCDQISPTVTQHPQNERIPLGHTASFSCTGRGEPLGSVSWSHGSTVLTNGGRYVIATNPGSAQYTFVGTLTISSVVRNDNGQYTCTVTNTAGPPVTSQPATLAVLEPPYGVTVGVTAQSSTTLRVSWTVGSTGNVDIDTSQVRHKCRDVGSWSEWISTGSIGIQGTYDITGLIVATVYDVQVRVKNTQGWSTPVQGSGRTRDAPPGPPSNLEATSISDRSIGISWQEPAVTNGVITNYYIQYGPTTGCSDAALTLGFNKTDRTTSETFPGLIPYTTYSFRVRVYTSAGPGDYTNCINPMTTESTPTQPASVELADVNQCNCETANQPRTVELQTRWRRPQHVHGELRGYNLKLQQQGRVIYEHNITQGLDSEEMIYVMSENDVTQGLEPAQGYSVMVSAYNDVYIGEVKTSAETLTSDGCPTAPLIYKKTQGMEGMCGANWTEPSHDKGYITGYSVIVTASVLDDGLVSATEPEPVLTSPEQDQEWTESLANLPAYSLIHVTVRAKTCAEGEESGEITCRVERKEPPEFVPTMNRTDSKPTRTSFEVSLPQVSQRSGPISCYQVIVVKMNTGETLDELTERLGEPKDILTSTAEEEGRTVPYVAMAFTGSSYKEEPLTIGTGDPCTGPCCQVGSEEGAPEPGNRPLTPGSTYTATVRAYVDLSGQEDVREKAVSRAQTSSLFMEPIITVLEEALPLVAIIVAVVVAVVASFAAGVGFMFYRQKYINIKKETTTGRTDVPLSDITCKEDSEVEGVDNEALSINEADSKCYRRLSEIRTVDDVTKYLKENKFGEYAKAFRDHEVDGDALKYLDDAILKDLIPKAGPRAKFKGILAEFKRERPSEVSDEATSLNFWEIPRTGLKLGRRLGSGQFGEVRLGELRNRGLTTTVAVKTLRDSASDSDKKDLLGEIEILVTVGRHDNIISLVGACTRDGPLMIVVEYAPNGCLKDWLKTNSVETNAESAYQNQPVYASQLPMEQLIQFGVDVANGMSHLAALQCVHRDLAARNILLGENLVAKVSDFGLSRDIYEDSEYVKSTQSKLPLRWMAYESLFYNVYTTQSDIWSFGVLLWEIMAMGNLPYEGMKGKRVMDMIKDGGRLQKPSNCPEEIYILMTRCWETLPEDRPTFPELKSSLIRIMQGFKTYASLLK